MVSTPALLVRRRPRRRSGPRSIGWTGSASTACRSWRAARSPACSRGARWPPRSRAARTARASAVVSRHVRAGPAAQRRGGPGRGPRGHRRPTGTDRGRLVDVKRSVAWPPRRPSRARSSLPPWDNSAMDGYAIRAADVAAATEDGAAPASRSSARSGPGRRPMSRSGAGRRSGSPPAHGSPTAPTRWSRSRRRRRSTPTGGAGPARSRCDRARSRRPSSSTRRSARWLRSGGPAATSRPGRALLEPGTVADAGGDRPGWPASGVDQLARPPAARSSAILATGDEVRSPGQTLGPAGIPDANGPALVAMVEAAGGDPHVLGIATDRLDDVKARLCARPRRGRRRAHRRRAACRSGRTTSSRRPSRRSGRSTSGASPSSRASRSPSARPSARRTAATAGPPVRACRATRSRRS